MMHLRYIGQLEAYLEEEHAGQRHTITAILPREKVEEMYRRLVGWQKIETCPTDGTPVIFANFPEMCLMALAPHTWSGRFILINGVREMFECSHAASNHNGEPTHWMLQPEHPVDLDWSDYTIHSATPKEPNP